MNDIYGIGEAYWEIPPGWRDLREAMIEEMNVALAADGIDPKDYHVVQVKEKYGVLDFHGSHSGPATDAVIAKYARLAACTCCECGKPAEFISLGWIEPWCGLCKSIKEREGRMKFRTLNQEEKEECGIC